MRLEWEAGLLIPLLAGSVGEGTVGLEYKLVACLEVPGTRYLRGSPGGETGWIAVVCPKEGVGASQETVVVEFFCWIVLVDINIVS